MTPNPRAVLGTGREQELAALKQHLAQDRSRLVTLLGPGGMGKTRLALEAGRQLASAFRDGVFYVPLPGYKTSQALAAGIAQAIGFSVTRPNMGVAELSDFLSNKQMLLIIDAAETATDVMPLFETLTSAPGIQLLVTSRRRIHFPGEFIIDVAGLPYPADPTDPMQAPQTPAYRLFVDRYERLRPRFRPTDEEKDAIARVCRMVAGMPLAIEMAASWGRVLTCQEIADRIASFEPLTAGLEDREQGLSGVFSFSWEMLTKIEQQAALRLSTFAGSFSRAAGEYVGKCPASTIMALVDNSFLQWDDQGSFRIHEVIRSYLRRRLNEDPDAKAAASRIHDGYFAELLDSDPATSLPQAQLQALTPDLPNIQQAWLALERGERTLARTRLTLAGEALHALHDDWYGAHALSLLGVLSRFAGELDRARQLLEQCLAIQQRLGDTRAIAGTLLNLGAVYGNLQQWDEAERYFRQARRYAEEGGHRLLLFFVLGNSAFLAYRRSLLDKAEALGLEALDLSIDLGHKSGHAQIAYYLALVALDRRSPGQALPYLRRALEHSLNARAVQLTLQAMHGYARYFALEGRYETAAALLYFVLNQSGYPKAARTRSEEVLAEVTPNLTARQQARAARKAAEGTLDAFVEELRQVGSGP